MRHPLDITPMSKFGIGDWNATLNMLVDISDRKLAETNQKVFLDELNHRVKNNMAILVR